MPWFEVGLISFLVLINGFFAMSELAVVSARRALLQTWAEGGSRGAAEALRLGSEPGRFLSSVQIGITLVGIFAGAYGGATLSEPFALWLIDHGLSPQRADTVAFTIVVVAITYLSLIVGELVPKQIALVHAESIARWVALPMAAVARVAAPAVWLLEHSSSFVLRLVGAHRIARQSITEEEVKTVIAEAAEAGVMLATERDMLARVMTFADLRVQALMTPRPEVVTVDIDASPDDVQAFIIRQPHSHLPVSRGDPDNIVGVIYVRDLLAQLLTGKVLDLPTVVREPLVIFAGSSAVSALEQLRQHNAPLALVVDEYGHMLGMVTPADILEALTGGLANREDSHDPDAVQRADGSWLFDGALALDEVWSHLQMKKAPERGDYHTLAGLVLFQLGTIPKSGDAFEWNELQFEVVDMDGHRIDKVLISSLAGDRNPDKG